MEEIFSRLDEISLTIKNLESDRRKLALFLRDLKSIELDRGSKAVEDRLSVRVEDNGLEEARFIGVDGGLARRSYHSLDLVMVRAVGAVFDYIKGRLSSVSYCPSSSPTPRLRVVQDASESDFQYIASFERISTELDALKKCLCMEPTILLADGSLVPHPSDQPQKGSRIYGEYEKLLDSYRSLYRIVGKNLLAGVVEDSRSSTFSDYISEKIMGKIRSAKVEELKKILHHTRDTNLLFHVLNKGERSFVMRMDHSRELGDFAKNLYLFYLKTTEYDRPVRIEFYATVSPVEVADRIASLIYSVSCQNQEYGLPPVLIEADSRAKIGDGELDVIHSHIVDRVGDLPSLYRLRRDRRPF